MNHQCKHYSHHNLLSIQNLDHKHQPYKHHHHKRFERHHTLHRDHNYQQSVINETGYIIIGTSYYRITIVNMTFVFSLTLRANISVNTSSFIVTGIFCTCVIIITYNISILRIFTTEIIIT